MTRSYLKIFRSVFKAVLFSALLIIVTQVHVPSTSSFLLSSITSSNNQIQLKSDWTPPPIPTLLTPSNNSYRNTLGLVMDWSNVTDDLSNPVYYIYQRARNSGFAPIAYTSGHLSSSQIPASGTPNGVYWWHVKACDTLDNCSNWSDSWKVIVDSTAAPVPTNLHWRKADGNTIPCGGATNNYTIIADWDDVTDPPPGQIDKYEYFITYPKLDGTTGTWSTFVTPSQYTGVFNAGQGIHTYKVRTYDKAGNISNWSDNCSINYDTVSPSSVSLSIEGSFTKAVEEKIGSNWTTNGNVTTLASDTIDDASPSSSVTINPISGPDMHLIGNATHNIVEDTSTTGNYVWENRLMQSFDSGAKSMSLQYNFFTRDWGGVVGDDPGFFIRLNGQEIFASSSTSLNPTGEIDDLARNSGWQEFSYDLSTYDTPEKLNLALYAGNTGDKIKQSWVYVDKITTYFVSAPAHAIYTLSGLDNIGGSGIGHFEYNIDDTGWQSGSSFGNAPPLSTGGSHTLQYKSVDNAGNSSSIYTVRIITDDSDPSQITDLAVSSVTENTANLAWTAPGNDGSSGRAALYDVRYSTSNITNDTEFEGATRVDKVPSPKEAGTPETLEILGLNPGTTYYFAIKTSDEAPNTSLLSNVVSYTTDTSLVSVNAGDIIINELMWMGSSQGITDEWIELRNMTDHPIALKDFYMTRYNGTTDLTMLTIPDGKVISAKGYFLISNFAANASRLKDTTTVDYQTTAVDLSNSTLSIKLYDDGSNLIDSAWNGTTPREGLLVTTAGIQKYYSMERTSIPGVGTNQLNWYSCIDEASTADFFDDGSTKERGTPRASNRSENEPYSHVSLDLWPTLAATPTPSASPTATLTLADDKKTVSFTVQNISGYNKLSYELSYDAFSSTKGMVGSEIDISSLNKYEKTELDLATCSGEVCTYDTDVKNVKLIITLKDTEGNEIVLKKNL